MTTNLFLHLNLPKLEFTQSLTQWKRLGLGSLIVVKLISESSLGGKIYRVLMPVKIISVKLK